MILLVDTSVLKRLGRLAVHYDGDFDLIASITGQRCTWVVPAGSVE